MRAGLLARRCAALSNGRLAAFGLAAALSFAVFGPTGLAPLWLAAPLVAFAGLVLAHDRALRARRRAERAAAWYEEGLARLDYRIAALETARAAAPPAGHLYAEDLDLLGRGSLLAVLSRARTAGGVVRLAGWLLAPAAPAEIRARQAAVAELAPRLDLRERLALVGEEVAPRLDAAGLAAFGAAAPPAAGRGERARALALPLAGLLALVLWLGAGAGPLPWLGVLAAQAIFAARRRGRVRALLAEIERAGPDLDCLAELLAVLEEARFEGARLAALREAVASTGQLASGEIRRLRALRDLLDARRNQLFAPLGALLLFTTQVALAVEAWRARCGACLARWLDAVAELEALASLAAQAFEHPADPFPEILEEGPCFEAEGLGHPLLAETSCVRNDLRLGPERRLLVVSGSNMSGKSTLLRSVGVNTALALAGGPVRAARLRLSPLALGASIRVHDSLLEGASRFYAEIQRLRAVVERTRGELPVLFLLDEILHGTNSHDRRIGAEAVLRSLVRAGALGLVTTHDLALARVADALAPRAANVHFEDRLEGGRIVFDYRLHPGVVTHSNALALMRAVGLEVGEEGAQETTKIS
jgi:hypothetical protein